MTTAPRFRYIGVTDECVDCEKCGKADLQSTVVLAILDADGNAEGDPVYYGSTCAARALAVRGGGRAVLQSARAAHHDTLVAAVAARRMLAFYGLPEIGEPTDAELATAAEIYACAHSTAMWASGETAQTWRARALNMLTRKHAALVAARLVDPVCPVCRTTHMR